MKTYTAKPSEINRDWVVLDATGVPIGRLCAEAAKILRGKHKPTFTTNIDTGDHVIIINAERAIWTGNNKPDEPIYRHTLYPGGLKQVPRGELLEKKPAELIRKTVKGMLPHNSLGAQTLRKLKVYAGAEHPHEAQIKGTPDAARAQAVADRATGHMRRANAAEAGG
jgi:large subunit ribosomal protein L13